MAAPDLSIEVINNNCTGVLLKDITSNYGAGSAVAVNDVTEVSVNLTYNLLGITLNYKFTLSSGTITAATLGINSSVSVTNILPSVSNTSWPFIGTNTFNLTGDYGVKIPTFDDDVFTVNYTIKGLQSLVAFNYSTARSKQIACAARCCLDAKWAEIDPNCSCHSESMKEVVCGESLYYVAELAAKEGNLNRAKNALIELKELCDNDCGC